MFWTSLWTPVWTEYFSLILFQVDFANKYIGGGVIGEVSCHWLILKLVFTFSRALCRLRVFASSFDWFSGLSLPSDQSGYLNISFTTLNWKSALS